MSTQRIVYLCTKYFKKVERWHISPPLPVGMHRWPDDVVYMPYRSLDCRYQTGNNDFKSTKTVVVFVQPWMHPGTIVLNELGPSDYLVYLVQKERTAAHFCDIMFGYQEHLYKQ